MHMLFIDYMHVENLFWVKAVKQGLKKNKMPLPHDS